MAEGFNLASGVSARWWPVFHRRVGRYFAWVRRFRGRGGSPAKPGRTDAVEGPSRLRRGRARLRSWREPAVSSSVTVFMDEAAEDVGSFNPGLLLPRAASRRADRRTPRPGWPCPRTAAG